MENEIVQVQPAKTELAPSSPVAAAMQILGANKDFDVDKLSAILELQMKHEANEARKAYHEAMSQFQVEKPNIIKSKDGHNCKYAGLSDIVSAIAPVLTRYGLSHAWETERTDKEVKVICRITHVLGHSEETWLSAPSDTSGSKNAIQAIGSTITYLQRYTLKAALGLAEADQDDDGNAGGNVDTFKPLSGAKKEMMDKVFDKLLDSWPEGKKVDLDLLCRLVYERSWNYPLNDEEVGLMAKFIVENDYINSICVNKKG
jgi:hypothetical protein